MKTDDMNILESSRAREIVHEILNFGVTEYQLKKIIKFLSMELEDRSLMKELINVIEKDEDPDSVEKPRLEL